MSRHDSRLIFMFKRKGDFIDLKIESLKIGVSSLLVSLGVFIGDTYKHLIVLLIFMFIDTVLGWIKKGV